MSTLAGLNAGEQQDYIDHVASAFRGIKADGGTDMEDAVRDTLQLASRDPYPVQLSVNELARIADRIIELANMVMQNSLVLDEAAIRREAATMQESEQATQEAFLQQPQQPSDNLRSDAARERLAAARAAARKSEDRL